MSELQIPYLLQLFEGEFITPLRLSAWFLILSFDVCRQRDPDGDRLQITYSAIFVIHFVSIPNVALLKKCCRVGT